MEAKREHIARKAKRDRAAFEGDFVQICWFPEVVSLQNTAALLQQKQIPVCTMHVIDKPVHEQHPMACIHT